jgi:hypothetical protein
MDTLRAYKGDSQAGAGHAVRHWSLLDLAAAHNGHLPKVLLGEDTRDGGAYDTMRRSKHACPLKARSQCIPGTSQMPIGGMKGEVL